MGIANWLVKEQFGQELSPKSRLLLTRYLSCVLSKYDENLAKECPLIILEYFGRLLKKKDLLKDLLPFVKDIRNFISEDCPILLALIFSAHLCLRHTLEHDVFYDLTDLKEYTPELQGLNYLDSEAFFINALDWNLTPRLNTLEAVKLYSHLIALASFFAPEPPAPNTIHPWRLQIGINNENVLNFNFSQPARTLAYQFLNLEKPENPYQKRQALPLNNAVVSHQIQKQLKSFANHMAGLQKRNPVPRSQIKEYVFSAYKPNSPG